MANPKSSINTVLKNHTYMKLAKLRLSLFEEPDRDVSMSQKIDWLIEIVEGMTPKERHRVIERIFQNTPCGVRVYFEDEGKIDYRISDKESVFNLFGKKK